MVAVSVDRPEGRIGVGSDYLCAHQDMDFRYRVTDWEPFDYFSTIMTDPGNDGLKFHETYQLIPTESGTEVRYTMGQECDAEGIRYETEEAASIAFLSGFWPGAFDELEKLIEASN